MCELPQFRPTNASEFPLVTLPQYQTAYPYNFTSAQARHTDRVLVTCDEGFRANGGVLDQSCSRIFEIECWDGYFRDLGVNTSGGALSVRCEPVICSPFSLLQDANAMSWSITTEVGYAVRLNVSCKPGYRAVDRGYIGPVGCSLPSWYMARCGACDWEMTKECQPVWCEAPSGSGIKLTTPANFSIYGQANMTVLCSDGYIAATLVTQHAENRNLILYKLLA